MTNKVKHFTTKKFFFNKKWHLFIPRPPDVRATGETFSSQKENIQHFKTWNFFIFFYFCGPFLPSLIRIQPTVISADPCGSGSGSVTLLLKSNLSADFWQTGIGHRTGGFAYVLPQGRFAAYHQNHNQSSTGLPSIWIRNTIQVEKIQTKDTVKNTPRKSRRKNLLTLSHLSPLKGRKNPLM